MRWIIANKQTFTNWQPDSTPKVYKMATLEDLVALIDEASAAAGSQAKLAELLGLHKSHITQMKQGTRSASWRVRGNMRVILGEDPTHAFVAAMAEDLAASENADEKKAANGFEAMLAAFPSDWRKRRPQKLNSESIPM